MRATPASLWLIGFLSAWLGAAVFSTFVAEAAFAVLPTRTLAGALVGRVLPNLFIVGIALGTLALASASMIGAGWPLRVSGIVMIVVCVVAQFLITPRLEHVREAIGGPVDALELLDPRRQEFGRLHGSSVLSLGVAMAAALVAAVLIARVIVRSSSTNQTAEAHDVSATF